MRLAVAICTWNRAQLLRETLASFTALQVPPEVAWRLLVVNNASSDDTDRVIDQFAPLLPICRLYEPRQGHCHSRNAAIAAAEGEAIVWTDDDVRVGPGWLAAYAAGFRDNPRIDFFGGPIRPYFKQPPPPWIEENWEICRGCFAQRDLGPEPRPLDERHLPYGANFGVRLAVQRLFPFDTRLGRVGQQLVGEDERDVMHRMLAQGHRGQWLPAATVEHLIPAQRMTERYVYQYYFGQGRMLALQRCADRRSRWRLRRRAWWQWLMYRLKRPWTDSHVWLSHLADAALARGQAFTESSAPPARAAERTDNRRRNE